MQSECRISAEHFFPVHTQIENAELAGVPALRIVKKDKLDIPDENTYAALKGVSFHNGTIEVRMRSRLLPDAPDYARGFIGLVYRAAADASEFESFYVRPANGRNCADLVRRAHGCQYFSYPGYTFRYFREFGVTACEAPVGIALDEWFTLRAVVRDEKASFYLNEGGTPVLSIPAMKHGKSARGGVGIFVDVGTEAFISNLKITLED